MLSKKISDQMNAQINHELYSAYLYLSMSAHFENENLPGFAHWMRVQSQEEVEHAMKFYNYIYDRDGKVVLQAIDQPPSDFGSPLEVFQMGLEHEKKVTGLINQIYSSADQESDYASKVFLNWFVEEQVEEEKSATDIVETLKLIGDNKSGIFMLDRQLGSRSDE
jgi:ferritin